MTKVFIDKFRDYGDERILPYIRKCLDSIPFAFRSKKVLLKPNMLMGRDPSRSITTHPAVIECVVRVLQEKGARILIGDSSGIPLPPRFVARQLGVLDIAERYNAEFVDFTRDPVEVTRKENKLVKTFVLARAVREADLVINLCKLKTHVQTVYTGAVKNLFGCIPGLRKPQFHVKFPDPALFGQMIADLAKIVRPGFTIMDGIVAMEGQGPSNGRPKKLGVLIASRDMVAVDAVACYLIGLDPRRVPILSRAYQDGLGEMDLRKIKLAGSADIGDLRDPGFVLVDSRVNMHFSWTRKFHPQIKKYFISRPVIDRRKCVRCRICVTVCPVQALSARSGQVPVYDYVKCIRCYCCHEMCPEQAIFKKGNLLTNLLFGRTVKS